MLDVLHYYFEVDATLSDQSQIVNRSQIRENIYSMLYDRDFKYKYDLEGEYVGETPPEQDSNFPTPFNPSAKPKITPTPFDPDSAQPFGSILAPPVN